MYICGGQALFLPTSECDECESLLTRIRALEDKLAGKEEIEISKTDGDGTVIATVLGTVERSEDG